MLHDKQGIAISILGRYLGLMEQDDLYATWKVAALEWGVYNEVRAGNEYCFLVFSLFSSEEAL